MIGETIGNFEIISPLGKGGMAEVWLARHQVVGNLVAIKLLATDISEDRVQVERFFNQAQAAGRIQHAGVGQIFDVGYTGGRAFLVMEYLAGDTLRRRLRAGALAPGRAVALGEQIASVLVATHAAGVIHRDLKPENIILVRDPGIAIGERAKLVDFGIAKLGDVSLTSTSAPMMGTPLYMSPEQWRSVASVDPQSDAYAVGCVLFEMLCGRTPFLATAIGEACAQHLTAPPPSVRSFAPDVPEPLDQLVGQLLEKDPAKRPTMAEVGQRLRALEIAAPAAIVQAIPSAGPIDAMQATQATRAPANAALEDTRLAPRVPHSRSPEASQATAATDTLPRVETPRVEPSPAPTHRARWMVGGVAVLSIAVGVWWVSNTRSAAPSQVPTTLDASPAIDATVTVSRDTAVRTVSKNTMEECSGRLPERDFVTRNRPEPISGEQPRVPKTVSLRLCFESATGTVDRVGVSDDAERDDPRLGEVVREAVLKWRYAPHPSASPLVCRAVDIRPSITAAEFDRAHPRAR